MPSRLPFPSSESRLSLYFQSALQHANSNASRLQIDSDALAQINETMIEWNVFFPKSQNKEMRTKSITQNKNIFRDLLIDKWRNVFKNIPHKVLTTEDRMVFNLQEKKTTRTAPPVPITVPIIVVDVSHRLQHTIRFFNSDGSNAKPYLCRGCQIWYKIGSQPTDVSELHYMATVPKSGYIHHFKAEDAGKQVHYWARWENTAGKTGAWGKSVSATVVA